MKNHNFITPEIKSISRATMEYIWKRWQFWGVLAGTIISSVIILKLLGFYKGLFVYPFFFVFVYLVVIESKISGLFWKRFAELNGWRYKDTFDPNQEQGVMFKDGNIRIIHDCIEGVIDGRNFRIFNYSFFIGFAYATNRKKRYFYTVFAFKFKGSFPHIYLNNKTNSYSIRAGESIPLPTEFEKSFSLSAPKEYEIEALEIFTPDVLASLLDDKFGHDVEFVNQEMLIFFDGQIRNSEQLEREFKRALDLKDLLDEKLDRFKTETIGDMPTLL